MRMKIVHAHGSGVVTAAILVVIIVVCALTWQALRLDGVVAGVVAEEIRLEDGRSLAKVRGVKTRVVIIGDSPDDVLKREVLGEYVMVTGTISTIGEESVLLAPDLRNVWVSGISPDKVWERASHLNVADIPAWPLLVGGILLAVFGHAFLRLVAAVAMAATVVLLTGHALVIAHHYACMRSLNFNETAVVLSVVAVASLVIAWRVSHNPLVLRLSAISLAFPLSGTAASIVGLNADAVTLSMCAACLISSRIGIALISTTLLATAFDANGPIAFLILKGVVSGITFTLARPTLRVVRAQDEGLEHSEAEREIGLRAEAIRA